MPEFGLILKLIFTTIDVVCVVTYLALALYEYQIKPILQVYRRERWRRQREAEMTVWR